jgi:D-glycero-D-manno-heptose 1,7-bisphosphate phosphatase
MNIFYQEERSSRNRALFLDRDGTLVHAAHYPSRPEQLRLYEHIAPELRALQGQGFRLIVITNQAGIAHGYFSEQDLEHMHTHLTTLLAEQDVHLDAIYHCPHHPDGVVTHLSVHCQCRKPQPGMLLHAARDHSIDLHRSWFIGDILDDIEAGNRAGCRTILVDLGTEQPPTTWLRTPTFIARDTSHALQIVLAAEGKASQVDLNYQPGAWGRKDTQPDIQDSTRRGKIYAR